MHGSHRLLLPPLIVVCFAGCTLRPVDPGGATGEPVRFSVEFEIDGDANQQDPRRRRSRYILEANRDLRVIHGASARGQRYPPSVHQLSHAQFHALYRHVVESELLVEPTSPNAEPPSDVTEAVEGDVIYRVALNVNGKWNRYATTPAESPPTVQLLAGLIEAAASQRNPWRSPR